MPSSVLPQASPPSPLTFGPGGVEPAPDGDLPLGEAGREVPDVGVDGPAPLPGLVHLLDPVPEGGDEEANVQCQCTSATIITLKFLTV